MERFAERRLLRIIELREAGKSYAAIAEKLKMPEKVIWRYEDSLRQNLEEILRNGASTLGEVAEELEFTRTAAGMAMQYFGLELRGKQNRESIAAGGGIASGAAVERAAEKITGEITEGIAENRSAIIEKVLKCYRAGERSTFKIAELTGLTTYTVYRSSRILRLGLPSPHSEFRARKIEEAIREGGSIQDVCAKADMTPWALRSYFVQRQRSVKIALPEYLRKELDEAVFSNKRRFQGMRSPHTRKKEEYIAKIRELVAQGKRQREIADEMGFSRKYICDLISAGNIKFLKQPKKTDLVKFTRTREMSEEDRAGIIREALAQGERSLENLVKRAECSLSTLHQLCRRYKISLPEDIIPYRYRPELDRLVDEGLSTYKIAQRYTAETGKGICHQGIDTYLTRSGQRTYWKRKREERKKMERPSGIGEQLSEIEEQETEEQERNEKVLLGPHDPVEQAYRYLPWNAHQVAHFTGMKKYEVRNRYRQLGGDRKESRKKYVGRWEVFTLHLASQIYQLQDEGENEKQITQKLQKPLRVVQYALIHRNEYGREIIMGLRVMFPNEKIDKPYRKV